MSIGPVFVGFLRLQLDNFRLFVDWAANGLLQGSRFQYYRARIELGAFQED